MIRNYLKIVWRNLLKNKAFSFINIFGLAIGIAVAMTIGLWIVEEYRYDDFHENRAQIYRVMINSVNGNTGEKFTMISTPLALADKLKNDIPEVKNVVETSWEGKWGLKVGQNKFKKNGTYVGEDFFEVFKFKFVQGNARSAMQNPESIILTEQTAKDLFGKQDPLNQIIQWSGKENLKVTGIVEDIPQNSSFAGYQYFMPFSHYEKRNPRIQESRKQWDNYSYQMYVELQPNATYAQVEPKIRNLIKQNSKDNVSEVMLHPMSKWRLYTQFVDWKATGGAIDYIRMFGLIGVLVLLMACINFINLSTARSEKRAKEVGVRKAIGSHRSHLIFQFLGESVLISLLSFVVAVGFVWLLLPTFNELFDTHVTIPLAEPLFWLAGVGVVLLTGLTSGLYPAFYLSGVNATRALKGTFSVGKSASLPRKALVVVQFSGSIALIISAIIVYQQIKFAQNLPSGYNPNGLMLVNMQGEIHQNYDVVKAELLNSGMVQSVTKSSSPIHSIWSNWNIDDFPLKQPSENVSMVAVMVAEDYFKTIQINLKEGRFFYQNGSKADSMSVIVNEAAVKRMRMKKPIGQVIRIGGAQLTIVGVVNNTIMGNPFEPTGPAVYFFNPNNTYYITFRIKENTPASEVIAKIAPIFNKYNPSLPFEYEFADEEYAKKFALEILVGKMAGIFAVLAILISCLGLFGLSAYTAERRTKEIGIRKVLGASVVQLWGLLCRDFVGLVLVSCAVAIPLALYYMSGWLKEYKNHIDISWWIFVIATLLALVVSLITISFQAIRAALLNPVKSLKTD